MVYDSYAYYTRSCMHNNYNMHTYMSVFKLIYACILASTMPAGRNHRELAKAKEARWPIYTTQQQTMRLS